MQNLYETKENIKTEYARIKKKKTKALPLWLLIIAIILGWYFYVQDVNATNKGLESQLDKLEQTIEKKFKDIDENFHKQDDKIDNVKQAKAKKAAEVALLQSTRPKPVQRVRSTVGNCEQYRPLVSKYAWNADVALAVMKAESGCRYNASNWNDRHSTCMGSHGLFQIACFDGVVYDPAQNIAIAYRKYQARGWQPWTVCTKGIVKCI